MTGKAYTMLAGERVYLDQVDVERVKGFAVFRGWEDGESMCPQLMEDGFSTYDQAARWAEEHGGYPVGREVVSC